MKDFEEHGIDYENYDITYEEVKSNYDKSNISTFYPQIVLWDSKEWNKKKEQKTSWSWVVLRSAIALFLGYGFESIRRPLSLSSFLSIASNSGWSCWENQKYLKQNKAYKNNQTCKVKALLM